MQEARHCIFRKGIKMKTIINTVATGTSIKSWMDTKGYSIADLSEMMGLSYMAIYKWIKGYALPSIDNFVFLAAIFDIKIDDLLVLEEVE